LDQEGGNGGQERRLHNEELHNLYALPKTIRAIRCRKVRLAGHVARIGEMRNTYKILLEKPEGKSSLGRPKHGWEIILI